MIVMEMKHNQNVDMFKCSHSTYRFLNRFKCKNSMYKSRLNHHRWEASYYMVSIKYQNKQQKIYWLLKTVQVVVLSAFDVLKISQSAFLEKKILAPWMIYNEFFFLNEMSSVFFKYFRVSVRNW